MTDSLLPWPFGDLKRVHYRAIIADPPWRFDNWSEAGQTKNPSAHYACQRLAWIKSLPVADLAHPDGCALVMWATAPMLPHALETLRAWGFAFRSAGAWAKRSRADASWAFGTGYLYRSATEFWLLGVRGRPRQQSRSVRNLIIAPIREHSRKPDQMRRDIETLFPGPYCELFAREAAPGWDAWGNEVGKFERSAAA